MPSFETEELTDGNLKVRMTSMNDGQSAEWGLMAKVQYGLNEYYRTDQHTTNYHPHHDGWLFRCPNCYLSIVTYNWIFKRLEVICIRLLHEPLSRWNLLVVPSQRRLVSILNSANIPTEVHGAVSTVSSDMCKAMYAQWWRSDIRKRTFQ